jgi:hypothetical protein
MKVGMYKQQRYDEGVKKIQESIDNIAGLDVVRDIDKQYLQSKLNQLGGQLSMVAGGDFSNFQLVNSVNGMTNQIAKDPNVINAVSNAARYKKDLETVAKLQQEGKWADSNQRAFNKDANNWLQGGLDTSYSANTSPYVDTTKEATDIVKAMAKDYTTEDVVFDYNEAGQIVGVRDALTRTKIEGITPQKIQTALKTGLSPQAWRQLSIDGQYKYSSISPDAFVNDLNSSYQQRFEKINKKRQTYVEMLPSLTVAEQTRLGNLIKELDADAKDLKSEYNSISSGFANGDVENAKAQFYTMNWLESTSNAMSSKGESLTYHTNPYKAQENFDRRMKQDAWFAQERQRVSEARLNLEILKYNTQQLEKDKKEQEERKKKQGQTYLVGEDEFSTSTSKLLDEQQNNIILAKKNELRQLQILKSVFGLSDEIVSEKLENINAIQDVNLKNQLIAFSKAKDESKVLEDRKDLLESMADKVYNLYNEDKIPESMIFGSDGFGGKLYHTLGEGNNAMDIVDISKALDDFNKRFALFDNTDPLSTAGSGSLAITGLVPTGYDYEAAEKALQENIITKDEYELFKIYSGQITPEQSNLFSSISMNNLTKEDYDKFMEGVSQFNKNTKDVREKRNEWIAEQLKKEKAITAPTSFEIDKEDYSSLKNDLQDLAYIAKQAEGETLDTGDGKGVSASLLEELSQETIKSATYYTNGNGNQGLVVNNVPINLPEDLYNKLRSASNFEDIMSPGMDFFKTNIQPQLARTLPKIIDDNNGNKVSVDRNYYTTASDSEYHTTPQNAVYKTYDFPNVKLYDIAANIVTMDEPEKTSSATVQMLVTDPVMGEERRLYIETSVDKIQDAFNMNLRQIYSRLYQKEIEDGIMPATPSQEYMKALNDVATKVKTD